MDAGMRQRFEALQEVLELDQLPERLECFDVSHTMGEGTVAACVVFDSNGPLKAHYRRFNIQGLVPGDDYGAIRQALTRRYTRLKRGEGAVPDVLFIDGGKGQLHAAETVLEELQVEGVTLVGVAKGPHAGPGWNSFSCPGVQRHLYCRPTRRLCTWFSRSAMRRTGSPLPAIASGAPARDALRCWKACPVSGPSVASNC